MRKFKVLVIAHSLLNNAIAQYGEEVCESQLTADADELVLQGFLEQTNTIDLSEVTPAEMIEVVEAKEVKAVKAK